jgi:hypothetical protein
MAVLEQARGFLKARGYILSYIGSTLGREISHGLLVQSTKFVIQHNIMKSSCFLDVTSCSLVEIYKDISEEPAEDNYSWFLLKDCNLTPEFTASRPIIK